MSRFSRSARLASRARSLLTRRSEAPLGSFHFCVGSHRRSKLFFAGVVLAMACVQPAGRRRLRRAACSHPLARRAAALDDSKFRVVFSGPDGKASDASEVTIVFSRPLRALDRDVPPPSIRMTPALAGRWLWVGSRALRFVPDGSSERFRARRASRSRFRRRFARSTGRPSALHTASPSRHRAPRSPSSSPTGDGHVPTNVARALASTCPSRPSELEKHLVLKAERHGKERTLAFRVERPDEKAPKRLRVVPKAPLPLDSTIEGEITTGLRFDVGSAADDGGSELRAFDLRTASASSRRRVGLPRGGAAASIRRRTSNSRIR